MAKGEIREIGRDWIAVILAIGLCTALNIIVAAILYDSIQNPDSAGISENATQILTGWGGGIIGILGAVFGYRAGATQAEPPRPREADDEADDGP